VQEQLLKIIYFITTVLVPPLQLCELGKCMGEKHRSNGLMEKLTVPQMLLHMVKYFAKRHLLPSYLYEQNCPY
jgi:hypothetical protein